MGRTHVQATSLVCCEDHNLPAEMHSLAGLQNLSGSIAGQGVASPGFSQPRCKHFKRSQSMLDHVCLELMRP